MNAVLEARPPARYKPGDIHELARGGSVYIFGREWGPDNRFIRGTEWVYEICPPGRTASRRTVTESQLTALVDGGYVAGR